MTTVLVFALLLKMRNYFFIFKCLSFPSVRIAEKAGALKLRWSLNSRAATSFLLLLGPLFCLFVFSMFSCVLQTFLFNACLKSSSPAPRSLRAPPTLKPPNRWCHPESWGHVGDTGALGSPTPSLSKAASASSWGTSGEEKGTARTVVELSGCRSSRTSGSPGSPGAGVGSQVTDGQRSEASGSGERAEVPGRADTCGLWRGGRSPSPGASLKSRLRPALPAARQQFHPNAGPAALAESCRAASP